MDLGDEGFTMQRTESGEFSASFSPTPPPSTSEDKCADKSGDENVSPKVDSVVEEDGRNPDETSQAGGLRTNGTTADPITALNDTASNTSGLRKAAESESRENDEDTLLNNGEAPSDSERRIGKDSKGAEEEVSTVSYSDSSQAISGTSAQPVASVYPASSNAHPSSLENVATRSSSEPTLSADDSASAPSPALPISLGGLGIPISTSTPVISRNATTASIVELDRRPLSKGGSLKDESESYDSNPDMVACPGDDQDSGTDHSCGCSYQHEQGSQMDLVPEDQVVRSYACPSLMVPGAVRVPIIGHETMEARTKFTVYKIHVMVEDDDVGWFIFRRYSDFVHLNDQLKALFPNVRLALPPKRWFRSNFDAEFLDERREGLQSFLDNVTGHRDLCNSSPVREFFCFDDPPGPHDSLEESRAQCECLEEMIYLLRREVADKDTELELAREELDLYKSQVQLLTGRLSELNQYLSNDKSGGSKCDIDSLFGAGTVLLKDDIK